MNRIRPIAGVLLATLVLSLFGMAATAGEVLPLDPGRGLPPIDATGPASGAELAPPDRGDRTSASNNGGGDGDSAYEEPMLQTRHFGLNVTLSCAVSGTPNAIVVVNHSAEALPPGTRIKWQLKEQGKRGFFALLSPLEGGDTLIADNVLDGSADQAAACVARVI